VTPSQVGDIKIKNINLLFKKQTMLFVISACALVSISLLSATPTKLNVEATKTMQVVKKANTSKKLWVFYSV